MMEAASLSEIRSLRFGTFGRRSSDSPSSRMSIEFNFGQNIHRTSTGDRLQSFIPKKSPFYGSSAFISV